MLRRYQIAQEPSLKDESGNGDILEIFDILSSVINCFFIKASLFTETRDGNELDVLYLEIEGDDLRTKLDIILGMDLATGISEAFKNVRVDYHLIHNHLCQFLMVSIMNA